MAPMAYGVRPDPSGDCSCAAQLRRGIAALCVGLTPLLASCETVKFYAQAAAGQTSLLLARRDSRTVMEDPATDPAVVARLRLVASLLRFAEDELALPVGDRYRTYVEVDGAPVWNVIAAREFSVDALPRCYPLIGCAVYRGYFSRLDAEREAARLAVDHDVHLAGVAAYSTLGWFADPVLSTFLRYDDAALADLLFHELAHSVVYVRDDSAFNEAFAGFVGNEGALRWLTSRGGDAEGYRMRLASHRAFAEFLAAWRGRLAALYRQPVSADALRQVKAQGFSAMRACYEANKVYLGGGRFDAAMARPFNNARLALTAAYEDLKPAFARLLRHGDDDWPTFYAAVRELAKLPYQRRLAELQRPNGASQAATGDGPTRCALPVAGAA